MWNSPYMSSPTCPETLSSEVGSRLPSTERNASFSINSLDLRCLKAGNRRLCSGDGGNVPCQAGHFCLLLLRVTRREGSQTGEILNWPVSQPCGQNISHARLLVKHFLGLPPRIVAEIVPAGFLPFPKRTFVDVSGRGVRCESSVGEMSSARRSSPHCGD